MERERLDQELIDAWDGDPWHGSPITAILDGIDAAEAAARPIEEAHTIWELVLHMTGWTREVARRVDGGKAGEPEAGDWPDVTDLSKSAWQAARRDLGAAHEELRRVIKKLGDEAIMAPPGVPRDRAAGTGRTIYRLVHGLVQHDAYHAGQIALLKKMI
ncbi:MAG: DinB family protein [Candidatus Eisenbacteria bacterium]|nr:DinB family protein [Candidatus Eisenbacteria bacterium]